MTGVQTCALPISGTGTIAQYIAKKAKDLSVTQARMIEREMQLLGYRATTERMSAEAAKKQAENTADKIIKDYERSGQSLGIRKGRYGNAIPIRTDGCRRSAEKKPRNVELN